MPSTGTRVQHNDWVLTQASRSLSSHQGSITNRLTMGKLRNILGTEGLNKLTYATALTAVLGTKVKLKNISYWFYYQDHIKYY